MKKSALFCLMMASVLWGVGGAAMEPMPKLNELDQKLFSLVKEGSVDIDELKELCEQGANIFAVDHYNDNVSLLHLVFLGKCNVVSNNIEELLDTLLTLGEEQDSKKVADWCNLQTKAQKLTALHCAACRGFLGCIVLLLHAGADPNIIEKEFNTPVTAALYNGQLVCAKCLLDHKNFDFAKKHGPMHSTILHDVCMMGRVKYVKLVVNKARTSMESAKFKEWLNAPAQNLMLDGSYELIPAIVLAVLLGPSYQSIVDYLSAQVDNIYEIVEVAKRVPGTPLIIEVE